MKEMKEYEDKERRKPTRINYSNLEKPMLKIGKHKFEVLDVSQRGLKFFNNHEVVLSKDIRGKVTFLCGESIAVGARLYGSKTMTLVYILKT